MKTFPKISDRYRIVNKELDKELSIANGEIVTFHSYAADADVMFFSFSARSAVRTGDKGAFLMVSLSEWREGRYLIPAVCECGSDKLGHYGHSHWCPKGSV